MNLFEFIKINDYFLRPLNFQKIECHDEINVEVPHISIHQSQIATQLPSCLSISHMQCDQ